MAASISFPAQSTLLFNIIVTIKLINYMENLLDVVDQKTYTVIYKACSLPDDELLWGFL